MLAGNYLKAKSYLRECLKKDPNPQLKGMVLNNLALAYYWQKYSALDDPNRIKDFKKDAEENIEKELKTIVFMLKDSIRSLEGSKLDYEDIDSIEETADKLFFANLLSHENNGFSHMNVSEI